MSTPDPFHDLDAYVALPRLGGLALNHDGTQLVVAVQRLDADGTAYVTSLTRVGLGGEPARRLTRSLEGESVAAFTRDGSLLFTSTRPVPRTGEVTEATRALWCLPADGGEAFPVACREGGWEGVLTAPDADIVVASVPWRPGAEDEAADATFRAARRKHKVAALLHEGSPVRFWDHDLNGDEHRWLVTDALPLDGDEPAPRFRHLGAGEHLGVPLALSADGRVAVTTWRRRHAHGIASTSLAVVHLATGEHRVIAEGDERDDVRWSAPVISRDGGTVVAVRAVSGTATEAPDTGLTVIDSVTGEQRALAPDWDLWPEPVALSADASTVWCTADADGHHPLFAVDVETGEVRRVTGDGSLDSVIIAPDESCAYAVRSAWDLPGEVVRIDLTTGKTTVLDCGVTYPPLPGRLERIETRVDDGVRIPSYLALPAGASAATPAPLVLWVHGGPLSSWNTWSWRWCPWLLVAQGYAVLMPDPALSTGYGRAFVQRGWGTWGEHPYTDVLAATDAVLDRDDLDATRTAMMGGSFGGYMANWIATHTDRFKAIVSHASLWNLDSFGGTTDASAYWSREMTPAMRERFSPHRFADAITTPVLVVHGDKDYRVPIGEGLQLWWALNQHWAGDPADLPHKLLYFPDENHWVLKPQHARLWYTAVKAFLAVHVLGQEWRRPDLV